MPFVFSLLHTCGWLVLGTSLTITYGRILALLDLLRCLFNAQNSILSSIPIHPFSFINRSLISKLNILHFLKKCFDWWGFLNTLDLGFAFFFYRYLSLCLNADDVETKFLCGFLLHCSGQWLHAVLYLSDAHPFHSYGVWGTWHFQQIQWNWVSYSFEDYLMLLDGDLDMGGSWSFWSSVDSFHFSCWLVNYMSSFFLLHQIG